jgi:two-component system sensor histidine kinase and response regulator WspE
MGMLSITIADDGRGVDTEKLRKTIVKRKMVNKQMAANLSESELLDFLFLPGFSTKQEVTEISGRGVGLDVVHSVIQEMRGQIRASSKPGKGMRIQLLLPLTLSVMRSLLVTISGQPYAFPLARIERILNVNKQTLKVMDEQQYMTLDDKHIGLVEASQVLELNASAHNDDEYSVIIVGDRSKEYGIVVDEFLGERDLAVHLLDNRLGKIKDISAGALMEDGTPLLIVDVDDLIRSIDVLVSGERLKKLSESKQNNTDQVRKKILVVDDSITVREVERNLLESRGYDVDIAVDGMDGWNTIRNTDYDLVISDIDMPRMNGFEFVGLIKSDPNLKDIPVMIVSYKDREEDREQGLRVGADYYLTKGSFHDESLIDAVQDLIGGV